MILLFETLVRCGIRIYRKIKYSHQFYFNIDEKYKNKIQWTSENIKNEWKCWLEYSGPFSDPCGYTFSFKHKEDAMAFKLRWL